MKEVNHARAAALAAARQRPSQFANAARTGDEVSSRRVRRQIRNERVVLVLGQQFVRPGK